MQEERPSKRKTLLSRRSFCAGEPPRRFVGVAGLPPAGASR